MGGKGTIGNVEVMLVDALLLIEALREGVTMLQSPSSRSLHQQLSYFLHAAGHFLEDRINPVRPIEQTALPRQCYQNSTRSQQVWLEKGLGETQWMAGWVPVSCLQWTWAAPAQPSGSLQRLQTWHYQSLPPAQQGISKSPEQLC